MQLEDVERRARQKPFKPFRVFLTDGTAYDIRHPEMILLGKRTAVIGLPADPTHTAYDRAVDVDLFHIVRMEAIESATPSNGQS